MKFINTFLITSLAFVACIGCGSEPQEGEPSQAHSSPDTSVSATVLEVESVNGNPSGLTPMDITQGLPAPPNPVKTDSSKPDLGKILPLSSGNIEITEFPSVKAAPGDGPRGPDGKVIDPQVFLKQLKERQAAAAPSEVPEPQANPTPEKAPLPVPTVRSLDPNQAPQLPGTSSEKSE